MIDRDDDVRLSDLILADRLIAQAATLLRRWRELATWEDSEDPMMVLYDESGEWLERVDPTEP